jgi:phage tail-like protein
MSAMEAPRHRFLNREGRWLDFRHTGLELRADGALQLESLPFLPAEAGAGLSDLPAPDGPAGVAALPGGDVAFSDPHAHRLLLIDGCDGAQRPVPCLSGPGSGPEELRGPRGLLHHRRRAALLVADSGNHRVQLLALPSFDLAESWDADGGLDAPQSLAADAAGHVYVADPGTGRLDKLDPVLGTPLASFWDAVRAGGELHPAEVAVGDPGGEELVFALDGRTGWVHVLETSGRPRDRWDTGLPRPMGIAVAGASVLVGDNERRRLYAFRADGTPIGEALGYQGPVAAVAPDGRDSLLVHAGDGRAPLRLSARGAHRRRGVLWGGPFRNPSARSNPRHLVRAAVAGLGAGAHVQLHAVSQPHEAPPPVRPDAPDPFSDECWRRVTIAPDATETLLAGAYRDVVWLGMTFTSEGTASPVLSQIRIDFHHDGYLQFLPPLYARDAASRELLGRWLALFETVYDGLQGKIDGLPRLFNPAAAPPAWLPWLSGWLALELPEDWDERRRRRAVAEAFELSGRRGTAAGLRRAVRDEAGVDALVEEPIVQTSWWSLADEDAPTEQAAMSVLGATTGLAVGEPQGAVAGTSAVLDGSFLSEQAAFGRPLFADVAHQFTVRLYRGRGYSEEAVELARGVVERERPAHTSYHLCVVEPCMRVGVQARVGVDAIVAGPSAATRLGEQDPGGLVLGGAPGGRLGHTTQLGLTYLTDTAADG